MIETFDFKNLPTNFQNFIIDSWLKSYKKSPQFVCIDQTKYNEQQKIFIDKILNDIETRIKVKSEQGKVISYLVYDQQSKILHYIYTVLKHRHKGNAKQLINETFQFGETINTSHYTKTLKHFIYNIGSDYKYIASLRYE